MRDSACVELLQWALPRLGLRWPGFRKVRGQVCKRIQRRMAALGLEDAAAYRRHLSDHPEEWRTLDALARVTISQFWRDRAVFAVLAEQVLPDIATQVRARGGHGLRVWSAGCGAGEEPYSVVLAWRFGAQAAFPRLGLAVLATDADADQCRRARRACYAYGSLKELPAAWRDAAFVRREDAYCLEPSYRRVVTIEVQDTRRAMPAGRFDLVLCRNLVFTYFDEPLQRALLGRLAARILPGGALVLGIHERLPAHTGGFDPWHPRLPVFRRSG